jgi:hypothetical protein
MITVKSQDYIVFKRDSSMRPQVYIDIQKDFISHKSTEIDTEKTSQISDILEVGLNGKTYIVTLLNGEHIALNRLSSYGEIQLFEYKKEFFIKDPDNSVRKLGKDNYQELLREYTPANLSSLKLSRFGLVNLINQINTGQAINILNNEFSIGIDTRKSTYTIKKRAFPTNPVDFDLDNTSVGLNFGFQRVFSKKILFSQKFNTSIIKNTFERMQTNFFSVEIEDGIFDIITRDELLLMDHTNISLDYSIYINPKFKNLTFLLGAGVQTNFFLMQDNNYSETLLDGTVQNRSYFIDTPTFMPGYLIEAGIKYKLVNQYFLLVSLLLNESYSEEYNQKTKGLRVSFGF